MKIEKIKPVPKYILEKIKALDKQTKHTPAGVKRFYSYLTKNDGELVKVTVCVKQHYKKWIYKQVAVHGIHSDECFIKDICFYYISGYIVGWYDEGLTKTAKWYEDPRWDTADDKYFDPFAPIINKEYLSKFPEYKYAAWELYKGVDILQYLRLYEKYPQTEYMVKLGLHHYVHSKQLLEKATKDKRFRKWLATNRVELARNNYYVSTVLRAYSKKRPLDEIHAFEVAKKSLCSDKDYRPIRDMLNGDYVTFCNYIAKQKISNRTYLDYFKACHYLGIDMSLPKNRYPHDFKFWHNVRADEYRTAVAIEDEKKRKELYEKFASVAEKYLPMQHEAKACYVAIIAKSPAELDYEGEILHHCVGGMGYDQKFIREETLIFFIRAKDTPNIPLVTVEYSLKKKKVLQCYADDNTEPEEAVLHYVNKIWLPYANKTLKKIAA